MSGPVPKRSEERRRRNVTPGLERPEAGPVAKPRAALTSWQPSTRAWYDALFVSGQSRFYEQTDAEMAWLAATILDAIYTSPKVNPPLLAQFLTMSGELLASEGSRRRLRIELVRETEAAPAPIQIAEYRERFEQK